MALLAVRDLHKSFGDEHVLRGISLTIAKGEVVVIMGRSGSGKSTLLRCINGLEQPDSGYVEVDGTPMGSSGPGAKWQPDPLPVLNGKRCHIGFVFQRFNLFANLTALDNVALGPWRVLKQPRAEARARAVMLLSHLGLAPHAHKLPSQMSGGQQQRVAIARALSMDPVLMLLDEPTSALDPEFVGDVLDTLRDLACSGMTMVIVTHEVDFAREVGDRALFMDGGTIVEEGVPEAMLSNPTQERTRAFLRRLLGRPAPDPGNVEMADPSAARVAVTSQEVR